MTCHICTAPITRHSKTGLCVDCANAAKRKDAPAPPNSIVVRGDKAEVSKITTSNPRTLAELVEVCEIDLTEWTVERWVCNKWEVGTKNEDDSVTTTPLFQIKAWLVRNVSVVDARAQIAALIADAKKHMPKWGKTKPKSGGAHALEISIPDLHLGKLAWSPETGYADYDLKLAVKVYEEALESLLARVSAFRFRQVIFPIGNDLFHSDTKQGTTAKGTPLDVDSRWHKSFLEGRRLLTRAIDRLRTVAPVKVVSVVGNHDATTLFSVADSLASWFRHAKDVTVMNEPNQRKYVEFGQNMILFTHGHTGTLKNLPLLMATEQREMFGRTRFHEAHTGHLHMTSVSEILGVKVRISPALCPPDAWHSEHQFVGQDRAAEAFVWHEREGLIAQARYTVT